MADLTEKLDPMKSLGKGSKLLLPHEVELVKSGKLVNTTHKGSTALWLSGASTLLEPGRTNVYRHMGDEELKYLVANNQLPNTQPYQTIVEGELGRKYCDKYLDGKKWVDSSPTCIIEFNTPKELIEYIFSVQHKAEDGCLSMGLGNKAGNQLALFNQALAEGKSTWTVVKVKRKLLQKK